MRMQEHSDCHDPQSSMEWPITKPRNPRNSLIKVRKYAIWELKSTYHNHEQIKDQDTCHTKGKNLAQERTDRKNARLLTR